MTSVSVGWCREITPKAGTLNKADGTTYFMRLLPARGLFLLKKKKNTDLSHNAEKRSKIIRLQHSILHSFRIVIRIQIKLDECICKYKCSIVTQKYYKIILNR